MSFMKNWQYFSNGCVVGIGKYINSGNGLNVAYDGNTMPLLMTI